MKYKYETHLHTFPASRCGRADVRESLTFYKEKGYDGVFLTNHFVGGNIGCDWDLPTEEQLDFYFRDYDEALEVGKELDLKVFPGVELTYQGTDFLIYGLEPEFWYAHPEYFELNPKEQLAFLREAGAFIVQAHPFREEDYIPCIRLAPRDVHAVEVFNACNREEENRKADWYADAYHLPKVAGSDNHVAGRQRRYGGICTDFPLNSAHDYMQAVLSHKAEIFTWENTDL